MIGICADGLNFPLRRVALNAPEWSVNRLRSRYCSVRVIVFLFSRGRDIFVNFFSGLGSHTLWLALVCGWL